VASSNLTIGYLDSVFLTATVQTNGTTATDASGNVIFSTVSGTFSTNALVLGTTNSLSITNLPRGTDVITIGYAGDNNYLGYTNTLSEVVTNHPPVAATTNIVRTAGLKLRIFYTDLTNNWSDADGDTVTLNSLTLLTTNNVTLATNSTQILYTNSPNMNDQITYTVSDGHGGTSIGLINVVINPFVTSQQTPSALAVSGSSVTATFYGIPAYTYEVQRSTNLLAGLGWLDISTNTVGTNGVVQITDTFSNLGGSIPASAYYRLKWHP